MICYMTWRTEHHLSHLYYFLNYYPKTWFHVKSSVLESCPFVSLLMQLVLLHPYRELVRMQDLLRLLIYIFSESLPILSPECRCTTSMQSFTNLIHFQYIIIKFHHYMTCPSFEQTKLPQ